MSQDGYVHLEDCFVTRATDKAVYFTFVTEGGECGEDWFPRSQIADGDDLKRGDGPVTVSVSEWVARQKNIPN